MNSSFVPPVSRKASLYSAICVSASLICSSTNASISLLITTTACSTSSLSLSTSICGTSALIVLSSLVSSYDLIVNTLATVPIKGMFSTPLANDSLEFNPIINTPKHAAILTPVRIKIFLVVLQVLYTTLFFM